MLVLEMLLAAGADVTIVNTVCPTLQGSKWPFFDTSVVYPWSPFLRFWFQQHGSSVLAVAKQRNDDEAVRLLEDAAAKVS